MGIVSEPRVSIARPEADMQVIQRALLAPLLGTSG
jgi:hypothetical protein